MKTFKQYLNEALDKPYKHEYHGSIKNSSGEEDHHYSFPRPDGEPTHVYISHYESNTGEKRADVNFTDEKGDIEATGKSGVNMANRGIATVKHIVQKHVNKHPDIKMLTFSGANDRGRGSLYTRIARIFGGKTVPTNAYSSKHFIPVNRG